MKAIDRVPATMLLQAPQPLNMDDGALDLLGVFRIVRRRIVMIVVITAAVTALALPGILERQPAYTAQARLMISPPIAASLAPTNVVGLSQIQMATELERLSSREISLQVIDAFALDSLPEFNPVIAAAAEPQSFRERIAARLPWAQAPQAPTAEDPTDAVLARYAQAMKIQAAGASDVILVEFQSRDPVLAAQVANGIARVYFEDRDRKRQKQVDAARAWLGARIDEQRGRVDMAEAAAAKYLSDRGVDRAWLAQDERAAILSLDDRHEAAVRDRQQLTDALARLRDRNSVPSDTPEVSFGQLAELRQDVQAKRRDVTRLRGVFNPTHVEVVRAEADLQDASHAEESERETLIATVRGRISDLEGEDKFLLASLESARADLERQAEVRSGFESLTRAVETEQRELDEITLRSRDLDSQAELPGPEVEILSPASVPNAPAGRGRGLYLIAAVLGGGILALTVACLRELLDAGVRSHDQLDSISGLTSAGMLPKVRGSRTSPPARTVLTEPRGVFADSIRGTIVAMNRGNGNTLPQSILVTSTMPGEGKSTVAAAMAIELATSGRKVLLVDCDLRRGRIGALFNAESPVGLSDFLAGDASAEAVIQHDRRSGIDLVSAGTLTAGALRHVDRVEELISLAEQRGQTVILDSPPVLATTEALLLAGLAERTLLVVRWGRTPQASIALAAEKLAAHSLRDVFCLLNRVDAGRHAQYRFRDAGLFTGSLRKYYS